MAVPAKFTPVQGSPPPPGKGSFPMFPIFALLLYVAYLGIFIIGPKFVSLLADEFDPIFPPLWRLVGAVVLFLALALIIAYSLISKPKPLETVQPKAPGPRAPAVPPAPVSQAKFKPVAKVPEPAKPAEPVKRVEDEPVRSQVITYPLEVEGGIFGDTYIGLSPNKVLKLRSLVVEPEYLS
ncbi:MAG: hypothetical protein ACMUHM_00870 [Thermoplasmatota archaeon]